MRTFRTDGLSDTDGVFGGSGFYPDCSDCVFCVICTGMCKRDEGRGQDSQAFKMGGTVCEDPKRDDVYGSGRISASGGTRYQKSPEKSKRYVKMRDVPRGTYGCPRDALCIK